MNVLDIELFKNLCQWDLEPDNYRDLHNDFACVGIEFAGRSLHLQFQELAKSAQKLDIEFTDVDLIRISIDFRNPIANLTIDNLHRGRFEINGSLIEADEEERGYFYLQFYEGPEMEFWSKSVYVNSEADS